MKATSSEHPRTRCTRDTDGDGDCASCARYGEASPCREVILSAPAGMTYETLVGLLERVAAEPYRDSWGRFAGGGDEAVDYARARAGRVWHKRPRYFVQTDGRPYDTRNHGHYLNRYGVRPVAGVGGGRERAPEYSVGVYAETTDEMMRHEAQENGARRTLKVLSNWADG